MAVRFEIAANFVDSPGEAERFQREVRAAAKLDHVNIVRAFDADQAGSSMLLAMEFVKGRTLADVVTKGTAAAAYACQCVRQAALGLRRAAPTTAWCTATSKRHNLMTDKGVVKILDFGLAELGHKPQSPPQSSPAATSSWARRQHMAPEQARNTAAADVRGGHLCTGLRLFYLLIGRPPFPAVEVDVVATP